VLAVDAKRCIGGGKGAWEVFTHGGRKSTGIDVLEWVQKAVALGAGEILLTSWDADGQRAGYDNELNLAVSELVQVPVIASGGAGTLEHLYDALATGKADAVLAASIFHYREYSIKKVKEYLAGRGIPVRK
jgi:cyclase